MALGVPILVLIWDLPPPGGNLFLGVAEPVWQAGSTGRRNGGKEASRTRRLGRDGGTREKGVEGCRSGQSRSSRPTCNGVGSEQVSCSWASVSFIYREENEGSAQIFQLGGTLESSQIIPLLCRQEN